MKSLSFEKRCIFVITEADPRKINEAKFKLASCGYGYGRLDDRHYWSLPSSMSEKGYEILRSLFKHVQRFG